LSDLEKNRETHLMAINEWRSAAKQLEEKIVDMDEKRQINQELSRGTLLEHKGGLHAPVSREIAQKHGVIKNARFGTEILHKGLFFAARPGDKVAALFWGKVAYAGWINGYGDTVIIDHGNHYYSLYAHNSKISKKVGDSVAQGEIVAESGESGSLRGPGLYFEIRHFSESLDPLPWLDLRHSKRL
jgi:septal ring factor EnvC (AmiA/AmiB activator)